FLDNLLQINPVLTSSIANANDNIRQLRRDTTRLTEDSSTTDVHLRFVTSERASGNHRIFVEDAFRTMSVAEIFERFRNLGMNQRHSIPEASLVVMKPFSYSVIVCELNQLRN